MTDNERQKVRAEFIEHLSKESQNFIVQTLLAIKDDIHRLDLAAIQDHVGELLDATTEDEED
jgi:hypothetical protein